MTIESPEEPEVIEPSHDWDEYKLIQDKIDKIGAFSFQAKGWSITLVAAVLVASKQAGVGLFAIMIAIPLVLVFWMFDAREQRWKQALYWRAETLEKQIATRTDSFRATRSTMRGPRSLGHSLRRAHRLLNKDWRGRLIRRSDLLFHLSQLAISTAVPLGMHFYETDPSPNVQAGLGNPLLAGRAPSGSATNAERAVSYNPACCASAPPQNQSFLEDASSSPAADIPNSVRSLGVGGGLDGSPH